MVRRRKQLALKLFSARLTKSCLTTSNTNLKLTESVYPTKTKVGEFGTKQKNNCYLEWLSNTC